MANTIAKAVGYDNTRRKETHRLGSKRAEAFANTWHTFTTCVVNADGSGYVSVTREGEISHYFGFDAEPKEYKRVR